MLNKWKKDIILISDYSTPSLDSFKKEILEEIKKAKYNLFEDLVYRFQLTYEEIIKILDLKSSPTKKQDIP